MGIHNFTVNFDFFNMKKANYLSYLSEYQGKMPLEVEKTFKHAQKTHKPKLLRGKQDSRKKGQSVHGNQSEIKQIKPLHIPSNKQNLHPNIASHYHSLTTKSPIKQQHYTSIPNNPSISPFSQVLPPPNNTKTNNLKQISVSLNRCNLQPSHQSSELYLVYSKAERMQLIVCQECSRQFDEKVRLAEFRSSRGNKSTEQVPQYKQYVDLKIQLQQQNEKFNAINEVLSYNLNLTLNKIRQYYSSIIRSIEGIRFQLEERVLSVYRSNVQLLEKLEKSNNNQIKLLEKEIQALQSMCKSQKNLHQLQNYRKEPLSIGNIGEDNIMKQVELLWTDSRIRSGLDKEFEKWFRESKFYARVQTKPNTLANSSSSVESIRQIIPQQLQQCDKQISQQEQTDLISQQQQEQSQQEEQQQPQPAYIQQFQSNQTSPHPSTINLKQLLPFTVSFPTTQSKVMEVEDNFFNRLSPQLNKVQSQELLISSLRRDQGDGWGKNSRTEPSAWRQPESNRLDQIVRLEDKLTNKQEKAEIPGNHSPKGNFIKQLHKTSTEEIQESLMGPNQGLILDNEGFSDLLCNQELTILQNPLVDFNKKPLLNINRKALKTSSVQSQSIRENRPQMRQKQWQNNPTAYNSLTIDHQTNHQISFEMDQNLIVDSNILPLEQTSPQNLDIISPAFKVI